jgi:hypothetical protein
MAKNSIITISSLRGGLNNSDPAPAIQDDEVTQADNVEFFLSPLGERRLGCEAVDLAASGVDIKTAVVFLGVHHPAQTDIINNELWAGGVTIGTLLSFARRSGGTWSPITATDTFSANSTAIGRIHAQSLHGKFFIGAKSNVDRLHAWDGTSLRRAGLAPPAVAPTSSDTVGAGTFADTRYYRVRFAVLDADGDINLMSEPSPERTHAPAGNKTGVTITRPATVDGNETHWILEASSGDGNWYQLATTVIATSTATDTTIPATGYGAFDLSPDIGDYTVPSSVKFVIADQDRLVFGGSWEDPSQGSRVSWTPAFGSTGHGNDERIPLDTDNFVDLDWMSGGDLTGLSQPVNGSIYAFKFNKIYKLQRSGDINNAYTAYLLSAARGAVEGSIVNGADEYGGACVYFLDPAIGPCRIGSAGLQEMKGIRGTWQTVNVAAQPILPHGIYYPDKQQVHWWVTVDGASLPNKKIVCQVSEVRSSENGSTDRGWSLADGLIAEAWCSTTVPEVVTNMDGVIRLSFRPYIGGLNPNGVLRCDVGDTDNETEYEAVIVTKPITLVGLLGKWGVMSAALLAEPVDDDSAAMRISLIRDYGKETISVERDFVPEGDESVVNILIDNLDIAQSYAVQLEFRDV